MKTCRNKIFIIVVLIIMFRITSLYGLDISFQNLSFGEIVSLLSEKYNGEIISTIKIEDKISIRAKNISMDNLMKKMAQQYNTTLSKKDDIYIFGNMKTGSVLLNVKYIENKKHLFTMSKLVKVGKNMEVSKDSLEIKITPQFISK